MKKTVYTLFLLMVVLFGFFGCSNTAEIENSQIYEKNAFRIVRQASNDGQIALTYIFPLNSDYLLSLGYDENDVKTCKFYLTTYVNALAQSNKEKETDGTTVGDCVYFSDVDGIGFSIKFENLQAQKEFFNIEDNEENETSSDNKVSGFFIKKIELKTKFPVSSSKSAGDLKMICNMAISSWCNNNDIADDQKLKILDYLENSIFIYDFATQQKNLKSDVMYSDEYFYHNVFIKTMDDIEENNEIVFWVTYANRPVWYAFAVVVVVVGMVCAYYFLIRKNKKKN